MQNKPSDTPKIVALIGAIVLVLIIVVWRIMAATQSSNTNQTSNVPTVPTMSPVSTASGAQITPASATTVGPGQVRLMDPQLDPEPTSDQLQRGPLPVPPGPENAFRVMKEPPPKPVQVKPPTGAGTGNAQNPLGPGGNPAHPIVPPVPKFHYEVHKIKVEGVLTGTDGFAMITEGDQTYFKHVGEPLYGFRVMRLSQDGPTVRPLEGGEANIWHIGEETDVSIKVPGPPPTAINGLRTMPLLAPPGGFAEGHPAVPAGPASGTSTAPTSGTPAAPATGVPTVTPSQ